VLSASRLLLAFHQSSFAVLGECAPVLDLPKCLSQIGSQLVAIYFRLAKPYQAKVTLGPGNDEFVVRSSNPFGV
jgi:hypothetical protein